jgi:hypothetical protein
VIVAITRIKVTVILPPVNAGHRESDVTNSPLLGGGGGKIYHGNQDPERLP